MEKMYHEIYDAGWLREQLLVLKKSMNRLAIELANSYGTPEKKHTIAAAIRYAVTQTLTEAERAEMKQERKFHKNVK